MTDVLTPLKGEFAPNTLETANLYNDKTKKKAYYYRVRANGSPEPSGWSNTASARAN